MHLALALVAAFIPSSPPTNAASAPKPGVVFVIGGIGGLDPLNLWAPIALPHAGVPHELRNFSWTHGKGRLLRDLQDQTHLLKKAGELADEVRAIKQADPDRPIYFVGHSAGAVVAIAAAEQLPPQTLERIILLASAISPDYNLRPAFRATRGEIVSFSSSWDRFYLDWGTSQFGTADRVYGPAAGLDGFRVPADLDAEGEACYRRLVQIPWRLDQLLYCEGGLHHSPCMPPFLTRSIAPWLQP